MQHIALHRCTARHQGQRVAADGEGSADGEGGIGQGDAHVHLAGHLQQTLLRGAEAEAGAGDAALDTGAGAVEGHPGGTDRAEHQARYRAAIGLGEAEG